MTSLSPYASYFRDSEYDYTGYLGTIPETPVFSRAVNMASITYPVKVITYDNAYSGTGSSSAVKEDMEIVVYSGNTNVVKGRLRVAAGGADATTIQVNEFAQGYLDLSDNDRFEVLESWRIHDKLVEASKNFRKDSRVNYSTQGSDPNPVANLGGPWFGFIDRGLNYATVAFYPSGIVIDPDGGTLSYVIDIKDGFLISGSLTGSLPTATPIVAQFPPGSRHVEMTVTNSGSGKTGKKYAPIEVYDRAARRPIAVQMKSMTYGESGWSATFAVPRAEHASIAALPDGAYICYFEEENYKGNTRSFGHVASREHIKFVGFLVSESIRINPQADEVTFEALGPLGILEQTPALPQLLISKASPSNWTMVKTLTVNRALWYLWYWHTSAIQLFDFHWIDGYDLAYARLTIDNISNLADQMRDIADSLKVMLTCDRTGALRFVRHPFFLDSADRDARTISYGLTESDILDLDMPRSHRRQAKMVEGRGITPDNKPLRSRAPGNAPGQDAIASDLLDRQIVADQDDINKRTGWELAYRNSTYYDQSTKEIRTVPRGVSLTLPDSYDVFDPALGDLVTLVLGSNTNARGIAYDTSARWAISSINISHDPRAAAKSIAITIDHETDGPPGVKYKPPQSAALPLPSITPLELDLPGFDLPPLGNNLILPKGTVTMGVFTAAGVLWRTSDYDTPSQMGGPTYTDDTLALTGTLLNFSVDAFSPKFLPPSFSGAVNGWLVTNSRIYRITDIHGSYGLSSIHTFANSVTAAGSAIRRIIRSSIAASGWVIVASYHTSSEGTPGVRIAYSTNANSGSPTFTEVQITSFDRTDAGVTPVLAMSDLIPGLAYVGAFTASGSGNSATSALYYTTDYGATWNPTSGTYPAMTNSRHFGNALHIPRHNNVDQKKVYWTKNRTDLSNNKDLYRSRGSTQESVAPLVSTTPVGVPGISRGNGLVSCLIDSRALLLCGFLQAGEGSATGGVYLSHDEGQNWTLIVPHTSTFRYTDGAFAGDNPNVFHVWGENGMVGFYDNSNGLSPTPDSRSGNISNTAAVIGLVGG